MIYTRAAASDYDDWEKLGNSGWGSNSLIPLARKVSVQMISSRTSFLSASTRLKPTKFLLTARQRTGPRVPLKYLMEDTTPTLAKSS